jgi:hypothetical protein
MITINIETKKIIIRKRSTAGEIVAYINSLAPNTPGIYSFKSM